MKVKNTAGFRSWFKNLVEARKQAPSFWDENFMGVQHDTQSGFFNMYHGDKEDIYGFLRKEVEMAEDGQAIYEFVQNAADSDSTDFYMFFNDKYFLAINNGEVFKKEGLRSILNIGQSHGKTDPEKIGRYGIGFKLVHRLVGKSQGLDELLNSDNKGYRGPVLFSWSKKHQFDDLLTYSSIENGDFDSDEFAWLLKIIITNFPAAPNEIIKDHYYNDDIPFKEEELKEFQNFLKECLPNIDVSKLNSGTIFFIKLGEGKYSYLKEQQSEYIGGLETSMHFLKKLKKIVINDKIIYKNESIDNILRLSIAKGSDEFKNIGLTEERDKMSDIRFDVLYAENEESAIELKRHPNIYKFFPAVKEVNNLSLVLNSNVFALSSNRQNLDNTGINKELLKHLAILIENQMDEFQSLDFNKYIGLFTSILLSDPPSSNAGTGWQKDYFYDILLDYIKNNIPTQNDRFLPSSKVVIKKTALAIKPDDFVEREIDWFYLDESHKGQIIEEAKCEDKLDLKSWGLKQLLEEGDIYLINKWIKNSDQDQYLLFLSELNKLNKLSVLSKDIEFIKGDDGLFYSTNEYKESSDLILISNNTKGITAILNKIDIVSSVINFCEYDNLKNHLSELGFKYLDSGHMVYSNFLESRENYNVLSIQEKKSLFNAVTSWKDIESDDIHDWKLFNNLNDKLTELGLLLPYNDNQPSWLKPFVINSSEYFKDLDNYLVKDSNVFESIIYTNWDSIIDNENWDINIATDLYKFTTKAYVNCENKRYNLQKYRFIFADSNFEKNDDVFFNKSFNFMNNYDELKPVFTKVFDYLIPEAEIVKYLVQPPFIADDDDFLQHVKDADLSEKELKLLLTFYKDQDINIFNHIVINEFSSRFSIETKSKNKQYYSDKDDLIDFIEENFTSLILLPDKFSNFHKSQGIFRNKELIRYIIENLSASQIEKLYKEFIVLIEHKEILIEYLDCLNHIELDFTNDIQMNSFEYKIISRVIGWFDDQELEDFKSKLIIKKGDIIFNLSEANSSNEITFKIDEKKYDLNVSKILTKIDSYANTAVLQDLKKTLSNKLEFPKSKVDQLFNISIEEDDAIHQIANQLSAQLEDNVLETAEQLAFTALYSLIYDPNFLKIYELSTFEGSKTDNLSFLFYTQDASYLRKDSVVSSEYDGINKLLKLSSTNPVLKITDDFILAIKPCFDSEGTFISNWVETDLSEEANINFFNDLYAEYNRRGKDSKRDFSDKYDWNDFNNDTTLEEICGFNPKKVIYEVEDNNFLLDTEILPDWLINWVANENDKVDFLFALGITIEVNVIKLRQYLVSKEKILVEIENISSIMISNTFEWLTSYIDNDDLVICDPVRVVVLHTLIERLEDSSAIEVIVDEDNLNESIEWDNQDYQKIIEEDNINFRVFILENPIPYIYTYDDSIIARKTEGDYLLTDEFVYILKDKSVELILANLSANGELDADQVKLITDRGLSRIKELEEENERLRMQLNNLVVPREEGIPSSNILNDNTDSDTRISISEEARKIIIHKLIEKGYIVPDDINLNWTIANNIINPQTNKAIKAVLKSARKGEIYFTPREWITLCSEDAQLFIIGNNNTVMNIGINDLVRVNEKFHLRFDTEKFAVKSNLKFFAEIFKQLPDTHFLFKAPISTSDFFMPFSLFNKNPTAIELTSDDLEFIN